MMTKIALGIAAAALAVSVAGAQSNHGSKNIVDTAAEAGSFTTLARALQAADLVDTLKGPGPYTVFAPTDAAFAKLPAATLQDLLKPENKARLQRLLTYHVVSGKVTSSEVVKLTSAKSLSGDSIRISTQGGTVHVDGATVVQPDIAASNGVIHVIDSVILPDHTK